jgi:hypothetical protein
LQTHNSYIKADNNRAKERFGALANLLYDVTARTALKIY